MHRLRLKIALLLDGLVWLPLGLILFYLAYGRPPLPGISGLDFPALGLGMVLLARVCLAGAHPVGSSAWARLWDWLRRRPGLLTAAFTIACGLGLSLITLMQHSRFLTSWDLGIFSQALWNTWHQEALWSSLRGISLLADHFEPILFLLTPLYALVPGAQTLLILQSMALALGAPAVYLLARGQGLRGFLGSGLSFLYLCHPGLYGAGLFDFHVIVLACPLWLWHLALRKERPRLAGLMAALALGCGEASWMVLFGLGLYDLAGRRWRRGLLEAGLGMGGFVLVANLVIPMLGGADYLYMDRYAYLGGSKLEIIINLITRPGLVWDLLITPAKTGYVKLLLGGAMFLPLLAPRALLMLLPLLGGILLSNYAPQWSYDYHYSALLLAPLMAGAAQGLRRLQTWWQGFGRRPDWLFLALVIAGLICLDASPMQRLWRAWRRPRPLAHEALAQIPPRARVAAQECLTPHLANRAELYDLPKLPPGVQYVLMCRSLKPGRLMTRAQLLDLEKRLRNSSEYAVHWQKGDCLVLRAAR